MNLGVFKNRPEVVCESSWSDLFRCCRRKPKACSGVIYASDDRSNYSSGDIESPKRDVIQLPSSAGGCDELTSQDAEYEGVIHVTNDEAGSFQPVEVLTVDMGLIR